MCVFVVPATQTPARCWGNSDFVNLMCVVGKWGETGLSPQGRWGQVILDLQRDFALETMGISFTNDVSQPMDIKRTPSHMAWRVTANEIKEFERSQFLLIILIST